MTITTIKLKNFENKPDSFSSKHSHVKSNHTPQDLVPYLLITKTFNLEQSRSITHDLQKHSVTANQQLSPTQQKTTQGPAKNTTGSGKTAAQLARSNARTGSPNHFCLITIKRTKNNTHATISNLIGEIKTKCHISAGQLKLPGGRRKTRLSQRLIYKSSIEKAKSFGYKYTVIHCKGNRGSKVRIFRDFGNSLTVLLIKDTTGAAHNGCRPRKVRRV